MTRLYNQPADFAGELTEGFVAANRDKVRLVDGGVVRSTQTPKGEVALVIGGGTGHYPAFCGLVGQGLAHGAAMGNLFASPSAKQIYTVAKAADNGGGVILSFGNYAGDVLHFGMAKARLNDEGIRCELIAVTDDISSASVDELEKRRGIAGDLTVFKATAAAAAAGYSFDEVLEVAKRANLRTRSIGVAFSGCTLPGADHPLFEVASGKMALGMGIHGEPGITDVAIPTADDLAEMLVEKLLADLPDDIPDFKGARAVVLLNGLGSVKYEELFVVYRRVSQLLEERNISIVEPEVGELVTSFDMAGISLTLFWLDDELESFWHAPASTPAFNKGSPLREIPLEDTVAVADQHAEVSTASDASKQSARCFLGALKAAQSVVLGNVEELGRIDAIAGDGDHGIGMERGINAAVERATQLVDKQYGTGSLLIEAGDAWADKAGGTSGALWGVALSALGTAVGDEAAPDARTVAKGVAMALNNISQVGKAQPGDKTMLDALAPFSEALSNAVNNGAELEEAWHQAADVAKQSADATADLVPKIGRARPLAEKSVGTPDPGAVSLALIVKAVGNFITRTKSLAA